MPNAKIVCESEQSHPRVPTGGTTPKFVPASSKGRGLRHALFRLKTSWFAQWLVLKSKQGVEIYCDRFHFPNHKSAWCKANVDPAKCKVPGFEKANTEAAEIAFAWLARCKHMLRLRNESRFLFFILRLAELRNRHLVDKGEPPEPVPESEPKCVECDE